MTEPKTSLPEAISEAFDSATCGIVIVDLKGIIAFANRKTGEILGLDSKGLAGLKLPIPEPGCDKTFPPMRNVDGEEITVYNTPLHMGDEPVGEMLMLRENGGIPVSEPTLPSSDPDLNRTLAPLIESFYDGVVLIENDCVVRVNSSYGRITGLKEESLLGLKVDDLDGETHVCLHTIQEVVRLVQQLRKSVTSMGKLKHGNEIYVTATPVETGGTIRYIVVNVRDVTELQLLKEEVSRLMALYLSAPEDTRITQITGQEIVTSNHDMRVLLETVARLAQVDSVIFFEGESGCGKEVLARLTHRLSARRKGPFISVNCGAIPETLFEAELFGYAKGAFTGAMNTGKPGLFELAMGGILFLDEVSEIPYNCQVKLLKVIESLEVMRVGGVKPIKLDVRILAATNRSLPKMVKEGRFREDLFYRLYVVPIKIPPLRERREDIFALAWHFLRQYNEKFNQSKNFSKEVIQILETYQWPGNVRELQNVIERLVLTSDGETLQPRHLPASIYQQETDEHSMIQVKGIMSLVQAREMVERKLLAQAMALHGTTREAARLLGVDHSTIVRKVKKYGLRVDHQPPEEEETLSQAFTYITPPKLPFA